MKLKAALGSLLVLALPHAHSATVPSGFTDEVAATGLTSPTAMAFAPDGRLFVCQQGGQLRVIKNGVLLATPFLTVTTDSTGERGLLGVAFDPNFAANQRVYIYYTVLSSPVHNRVSRFTANGDVAAAGSEVVLLDLNDLSSASNHNGGALHFGLDGKLYIGVGENANSSNAQTLANLLGKILRINADGTIPADNPFVSTAMGVNRAIWALGLRNPFTFAVQPGSGQIFINDVGQSTWEEIDRGAPKANYGWPTCEGACNPPNSSFVDPIYQYSHPSGCAIAGGVFYNPPAGQFPSTYSGKYFFADLCGGGIHLLDWANGNTVSIFATGLSNPVDLRVSADGFLYYLQRGGSATSGMVGRIGFTTAPTTTLMLLSDPSGLDLNVDGQVVTTPFAFESEEGTTHTLSATSSQRINKTNYSFQSWSDGGAQTHAVVTPANDTSYTAVYVRKGRR